jgi:hypothetical protein
MNSFKNAILERRKSEKPESLRKSPESKPSADIFRSTQKDSSRSPVRVKDHSKTRPPFKIYNETTDEEKSVHKQPLEDQP